MQSELLHFNALLTEGTDPESLEVVVYEVLQRMNQNLVSILGAENKGAAASLGGQYNGTDE